MVSYFVLLSSAFRRHARNYSLLFPSSGFSTDLWLLGPAYHPWMDLFLDHRFSLLQMIKGRPLHSVIYAPQGSLSLIPLVPCFVFRISRLCFFQVLTVLSLLFRSLLPTPPLKRGFICLSSFSHWGEYVSPFSPWLLPLGLFGGLHFCALPSLPVVLAL